MITLERISKLAVILGLTPTRKSKIVKSSFNVGYDKTWSWWIVGCKEGDQPIPMTGGVETKEEALEIAEEWFGIR